ncbi:hypothetical protein APUTEX25_005661, partial [Auxenochlorella protothecoides]
GVADMLASQGFKKAQVEKALMALAEAGKISCKEFGKQKLFIPSQEGLPELDAAEKDAKLSRISQLQQSRKEFEAEISAQRKELAQLNSVLTVEELQAQIATRLQQVQEAETKLAAHRGGGIVAVSAEDVAAAEQRFATGLTAWERYRRMFRDIWDTVSENLEANQADVFEDMGVETDEAIGETLAAYQHLLPGRKKAKAC